ncbi:hypothetical protein BV133_2766 [Blastochloris viridis]|uniref:Uncharacterized protein n=1 Tax=Blastochloris viridis TaxID=1079 RepID=A0A182D4I6_BLAVI|nr:hypothetical protein BV133_2766 [Blastochloris viridis]
MASYDFLTCKLFLYGTTSLQFHPREFIRIHLRYKAQP